MYTPKIDGDSGAIDSRARIKTEFSALNNLICLAPGIPEQTCYLIQICPIDMKLALGRKSGEDLKR